MDAVFAALADATRRAVLARLTRGPATVGELAEPFSMSLPAVSKHLTVLERAGLLRREREGRTQRCYLDPRPLESAGEFIDFHRAFWQQKLAELARYLERAEDAVEPSD